MLQPRQKLGKYRIRRRLAEGGFAEVYEAYDTIEGVRVAIKVPHARLVDAKLLEEFRREARLVSTLDHPHILPIKTAQFIDGVFVIVYPLGECTLADRMQRRLSIETRIALAEQMLEAVAHAHRHGIVHCDLKPENFILFPGPRLRLTDFGISRLAQRTVLVSGSGTLGYVAPEQAMGRTSFRSDVFSLGVILYQLFSGVLPEWPYPWPPPGYPRLRRSFHPDFLAFLRRAIQVDQRRRFADGVQMLAAFRRLKARGRLVSRALRRRRARKRAGQTVRDWRQLRHRQFEREYRQALDLVGRCPRCEGPIAESMIACPWCGHAPASYRGRTRRRARCPRCRRGRNPDWRFCAWCYGPGFRQVSTRHYKDAHLSERCQNPACRRPVARFMRYCPWCRRKQHRGWRLPGSTDRCPHCGWGVAADYWSFCPWCRRRLAAP